MSDQSEGQKAFIKAKEEEFIILAKYLEELQKKVNETRESLDAAMRQLDFDHTCQDSETGTVYKIVEPKGTFMYYKTIDYVRTALEGERAGTLSKKEAESLGFVLKK